MQINTNTWNKVRYTIFTPLYDLIGQVFTKLRKESIEQLQIKPQEQILLIGAGTGLDLVFIEKNALITATDLTPAMVKKIKDRSRRLNLPVNALVMDGQQLQFDDNYFDKIILHLIVAVIPDPVRCMKEAERVLKPGGLIVIFDKFLPAGQKLSVKRKFANLFTNLLFSNINRRFETILGHTNLKVVRDRPVGFGGNFRIILLTK
jgi:ubiquinone/menaquinone biosynthesis C-methylase UbiE